MNKIDLADVKKIVKAESELEWSRDKKNLLRKWCRKCEDARRK